MHIIPVIDLQAGQVVHATGGHRHLYRPVVSVLCDGADPLTMARQLCEHCATGTLYVADLDALQGRPPQAEVLAAMLHALPGLQLWLDAGFHGVAPAQALFARFGAAACRVRPVFGSESLRSIADWTAALDAWPQAVLSLDGRQGRPLDPAGVWETPDLWPADVIAMGLERVGSRAGPDLDLLATLRRRAPQRRWVGSGGIRDSADLAAAHAAGAHAWLVASALHDGRLPAQRAIQATPAAPLAATHCGARIEVGHSVWRALAPAAPRAKPDGADASRDRTHPLDIGFAAN